MSRAWLMSRLGRHAEAARVAGSAQRIAERIGSAEVTAMADAETGRVLLRAGSHEEAAALLARALGVRDASIGRPMARLALEPVGHSDCRGR
jgi:hypothetical protein